ncbi:MAG: LytTR family transcriptional regulator, partial [Thermoflexibacter sp.]|nr:LytTR family transcriptional regulator [Thermoflexibacter sp.]
TFITSKKKYVSYQTLKSIEEVLDPAQFVRIHRSTILNKKQVQKLINLPSGDAWVEIGKGEKLRVSRTYKKNLLS